MLHPFRDSGFSPRLEYFETGSFQRSAHGWVHTKRVPYLILARTLEGRYRVEFDGQAEDIDSGCYFVAPPNRTLTITHFDGPSGFIQARWLHFRIRLDGLWDPVESYSLPRQLSPGESNVLDSLLDDPDLQLNEDGLLPSLNRQEVALRALRMVLARAIPRDRRRDSPGHLPRLQAAIYSVEANPAARHTVQSLAATVALSPAHFHELFLQATGTTPMRWVRTRRLEVAAQLLTAGEATLAEVAGRTGFLDASHLSHAFSRHFGMAPGEYREVARSYQTNLPQPISLA